MPLNDPGTKIFDISHKIFLKTMHDFIKDNALRYPINLTDLSGTDRARGFFLHDLLVV